MLRRCRTELKEASSEKKTSAGDAGLSASAVPARKKLLGDILLESKLVTEEQLQEAIAVQKEEGGFVGQILQRLGYVSQDAVASCLVKQCKIPHLSLLDYEISQEVIDLVPKEICLKHNLLPIDRLGRILTVAMTDPLDTQALESVCEVCPSLKIKPILCNWQHFEITAAKVFSEKRGGAGDGALTAEALGLAAAPAPTSAVQPKKKPQPRPPVKAAKPEPTPQDEPAPGAKAHAGRADEDLARRISDGVSAAMQQTLGEFFDALRADSQRDKDVFASPKAFGEVIRESVGAAMRDALAGLAPRLGTLDAVRGADSDIAAESRLAEVLRDSHAALTERLRKSSESVHGDRDTRLAEIAESMAQTVQQTAAWLEKSEVSEDVRRGLTTDVAGRFASVSPFGNPGNAEAREPDDALVSEALGSDRPLEALTFDSFLPGQANAFTFKLGQAVARTPGARYNPFFLYGSVGTGKTHLISAIGNVILTGSGGAQPKEGPPRVGYVSASHFSRRLLDAMRMDAQKAFRDNYCHWDVLILDDIQFLGGRVEAQEEFFHIFNVLHQHGRQIIIAGDKPPDRLGLLEQRLVSRFASGIVAELKAPEWETRMDILRKHVADTMGGNEAAGPPEAVLSLIAMRVPNDVRKMTGALRKIVAFADLVGHEITCEMADEILSHLGAEQAA